MKGLVENITSRIEQLSPIEVEGKVTIIRGQLIEAVGVSGLASIGSPCKITTRAGKKIRAEVIGMNEDRALLMPFQSTEGLGVGCKVTLESQESAVLPHKKWLGRVINAFAEPIDDKGPLTQGELAYPIRNNPPPAHKRKRVGAKIDLGVRAINTFITCCRGQRLGIFAGSGVGKSVLLSMMTSYSDIPIKVVGLIGERGREVQEFIEEYLGEEGLKNTVLIVATSDESALMRKQAAYLTLAVAEYFRDQGEDVLCLMDSITRFAMAQREIGLAAGEPPAAKGYTPTVFAELPKMLERAGPGTEFGSITGLFTVLVEGDDHNEPISDAVRGILDGHIMMDRKIAERGRFPAVDVLRSVSRTMPGCNNTQENELVIRAKKLLSTYNDMAELIRLGAYRAGSNKEVDEAIHYQPMLEEFLKQAPKEETNLADGYQRLAEILAPKEEEAKAHRMSTIHTLIELRQKELDEKRRALKSLEERNALFNTQKQVYEAGIINEQRQAAKSPMDSMTLPAFIKNTKAQIAQLEQSITLIEREIERTREEMSELFLERKRLEIYQDAKDEEARKELEKRENSEMDELGLRSFTYRDEG